MTHRTWGRLLALLLTAGSLLAPAAAYAERVAVDDATGDVLSGITDPFLLSSEGEPVPAPDATTADIVRTIVDHGTKRLRVATRYRDPGTSFSDTLVVRLRTPTRSWVVYAQGRGAQAAMMLSSRPGLQRCEGLGWHSSRATATIVVSVPTACLGDPRWVQVAVFSARTRIQHDPEVGDRTVAFLDDAFSAVFDSERGPTFGPRVARG